MLKKGPAFGDHNLLRQYALNCYKVVTGKDIKKECDRVMERLRETATDKQTFIH